MNVLLLEPHEIDARGRAVAEGERARHVREILRLAVGDRLDVGCVGGALGEGEILAQNEQRIELAVRLDRPPPPPLPVTLVLALPRPPVLRRLLAAAASFGVKRIALLHAARVEKSYWRSKSLAPGEVRRHLLEGLAQARDTVLPAVFDAPRFRPFVEDVLPGWIGEGVGLVGDLASDQPCPSSPDRHVVLVVGPEGGWTDFELDLLARGGARRVRLGQRALRVESAVLAFLGRLGS